MREKLWFGVSFVVSAALVSACAAPGEDAGAGASAVTNGSASDPELDIGSGEEISLAQNTTWTIDMGASKTYRVVAYGDSIFAGYQRSIFTVARRSGPHVAGEYLAHRWGANVEVVRRTTSGALSSEIVGIVDSDRSYMADASTRAVYFEMCGNDYLQARTKLRNDTGSCDLSGLGLGEMQTVEPRLTKAVFRVLTLDYSVGSRKSYGGTAPANVRRAVAKARDRFL